MEAILQKHDAATLQRRFNAVLATASINDAIAYYHLFKNVQAQRKAMDENFVPLNISCVFSPPVKVLAKETETQGNKNAADIKQLQEDLQQEKLDNETNPEEKKLALKTILNDYNQQFGTNHTIGEFDSYYQNVQQRIKDHKYSNADYAHKNKIDLLIVVDMLLTGFDSKYLNTLYVDKNLKYHGLIQAFSRTNRILNNSKPYGNILDFRGQQNAVDEAIALFCGEDMGKAKKRWSLMRLYVTHRSVIVGSQQKCWAKIFVLKVMGLRLNQQPTLHFYCIGFTFWVKKVPWQLFYPMVFYLEVGPKSASVPNC